MIVRVDDMGRYTGKSFGFFLMDLIGILIITAIIVIVVVFVGVFIGLEIFQDNTEITIKVIEKVPVQD